jgi:CRP/FNR family cyclic AMP-dependent transcriptional regulator
MTPAEDPLECHELSEPLRALARKGDLRRYRKGAILIEEGERGDTLFIILAGRLRAFSDGGNGRQITYGIYGPGEYLGEMSLDGGPRSASVSAVEDSRCAVVTQLTSRRTSPSIRNSPSSSFRR